MTFSVFPSTQTRFMRDRLAGKRLRPSSNTDASTIMLEGGNDAAIALQITPIYRFHDRAQNGLPGLSFSAQLLELGLKYNVEGLIQKAHEQLSYHGAEPHSAEKNAARHYERAQDNFARDSLHMIERSY